MRPSITPVFIEEEPRKSGGITPVFVEEQKAKPAEEKPVDDKMQQALNKAVPNKQPDIKKLTSIDEIFKRANDAVAEEKRISSLPNPFLDKKSVTSKYLTNPENKQDLENIVEDVSTSVIAPGIIDKPQLQLQQYNIYKKGAQSILDDAKKSADEIKKDAQGDLTKLAMVYRNLELVQDKLSLLPKNDKGQILITTPEQENIYKEYEAILQDANLLKQSPKIQAAINADSELADYYKLYKKAIATNKEPEINPLAKMLMEFNGGVEHSTASGLDALKDFSIRSLIEDKEKVSKNIADIEKYKSLLNSPEADKPWMGGKTMKDFYQSAIATLEKKNKVLTPQSYGDYKVADFVYHVADQFSHDLKKSAGYKEMEYNHDAGFGDPDFYIHTLPKGLGSTASMFVGAIAANALVPEVTIPAGTTWLGRLLYGGLRAAKVGATATLINRPIEGAIEAGSTYDEGMNILLSQKDENGNPQFTEMEANKIMQPHVDRILALNIALAPLDVIQYGMAFLPIAKTLRSVNLGPTMATAIAGTTKVAIDATTEGLIEENWQGLWQWQERQKLLGKLPSDADFFDGYDQWKQTAEYRESVRTGIAIGALMGGMGEAFNYYEERQKDALEVAQTTQQIVDALQAGKLDVAQEGSGVLRNKLFSKAAVQGNVDALIESMRVTREQTRPTMTEEENAKQDEAFLGYFEELNKMKEQAKGLASLSIDTQSKEQILVLNAAGEQLRLQKEAHIAELQAQKVNQNVINAQAAEYDSYISENDRNIEKITKGGLKKFLEQEKARKEGFGSLPTEIVASPVEAKDEVDMSKYQSANISPTTKQRVKQLKYAVMDMDTKIAESTPGPKQDALIDARNKLYKQLEIEDTDAAIEERLKGQPTRRVQGLLEEVPDEFDITMSKMEQGKRVNPKNVEEAKQFLDNRESALKVILAQKDRDVLSRDIQAEMDKVAASKAIIAEYEKKNPAKEKVVEKETKPVADESKPKSDTETAVAKPKEDAAVSEADKIAKEKEESKKRISKIEEDREAELKEVAYLVDKTQKKIFEDKINAKYNALLSKESVYQQQQLLKAIEKSGINISDSSIATRPIKNQILKKSDTQFGVLSSKDNKTIIWAETLEDAFENIKVERQREKELGEKTLTKSQKNKWIPIKSITEKGIENVSIIGAPYLEGDKVLVDNVEEVEGDYEAGDYTVIIKQKTPLVLTDGIMTSAPNVTIAGFKNKAEADRFFIEREEGVKNLIEARSVDINKKYDAELNKKQKEKKDKEEIDKKAAKEKADKEQAEKDIAELEEKRKVSEKKKATIDRLAANKSTTIRYKNNKGEVSERTLSNIRPSTTEGVFDAFDTKRNTDRTFQVANIEEIISEEKQPDEKLDEKIADVKKRLEEREKRRKQGMGIKAYSAEDEAERWNDLLELGGLYFQKGLGKAARSVEEFIKFLKEEKTFKYFKGKKEAKKIFYSLEEKEKYKHLEATEEEIEKYKNLPSRLATEQELEEDNNGEGANFSQEEAEREIKKVRFMYDPRNENGERIGIKDKFGNIIPERKIEKALKEYARPYLNNRPVSYKEFYAKFPMETVGQHLQKYSEAELISLFNFTASTKSYIVEAGLYIDGEFKIIESNRELFDRSLIQTLKATAEKQFSENREETRKILSKIVAAIDSAIQNGNQAWIKGDKVLGIESPAKRITPLFKKWQEHNNNSRLSAKSEFFNSDKIVSERKKAEAIKEQMKPILRDLIRIEAKGLEMITAIPADYWIKSVDINQFANDYTTYNGNLSSILKKWVYKRDGVRTLEDFEKNLLTATKIKDGKVEDVSQVASLVSRIGKNPEVKNYSRSFISINDNFQNADVQISTVDMMADLLPSKSVQEAKRNQDNEYVKFFNNKAPLLGFYEGVKDNTSKASSPTSDISDQDLLYSMFEEFAQAKKAEAKTYKQFFNQQKDFSQRLTIEAPRYTVGEAYEMLEKRGLVKPKKAGEEIGLTQHEAGLAHNLLAGVNLPLTLNGQSLREAVNEFVFNYTINKHNIDNYFQPEKSDTGVKNYESYNEMVKRSIVNRGWQMDGKIIRKAIGKENLSMVVLADPKQLFKLAGNKDAKKEDVSDGMYFVRDRTGDLAFKPAAGSIVEIDKTYKFTYSNHDEDATRTFIKGHGIKLTKSMADFNDTYAAIYKYMEENDIDFLAFDSSVKKYDKANKQLGATWKDGNVTIDKFDKAKHLIEVNPDFLLIQQNLKQEEKFAKRKATTQQFYYNMRFAGFEKVQEVLNELVEKNNRKFISNFNTDSEIDKKKFIASTLSTTSDKYDFARKLLSNPGYSLNGTFLQPLQETLMAGHIAREVLEISIFKQISIEVPLLGKYKNADGEMVELKGVRIENGQIQPGEGLFPAAYQEQGFKVGEIVFINRVPGTELHSSTAVKIMGFLPEDMGNIIMTDQETRLRAGADYDGDLRHIWGKFKNRKTKEDVKGDTYEGKMNHVFDLMVNNYLGKGVKPGGLNQHYEMLIAPIDTKANQDMIKNHEERRNRNLDRNSLSSFLYKVVSSQDGAKTIAIGARFNAVYAMLQKFDSGLKKLISIPNFDIDENGNTVGVESDKNQSLKNFAHEVFKKEQQVRTTLANFLNHSTDNPTLGKLDPMGINRYTASLAYMFVGLGMDEQQVYNFLNHPIVREYVEKSRFGTSPFIGKNKRDVIDDMAKSYMQNATLNFYNIVSDNNKSGVVQINSADALAKTPDASLQVLALLKYSLDVAENVAGLGILEKLGVEPVATYSQFREMQQKWDVYKNGVAAFFLNGIMESPYMVIPKIGLNSYRNVGEDYYPFFTETGEEVYDAFTAMNFFDKSVGQQVRNGTLGKELNKQFVVDALDITMPRAKLAEKAKAVYDALPEDNAIKTLLRWDEKREALVIKDTYKNELNENEKQVFRDAFEALRKNNNLDISDTKQSLGRWDILLQHQVVEHGWSPNPKGGEYASFMDVGTHVQVSQMQEEMFREWDDAENRPVNMVRRLQLNNPALIPAVTISQGNVLNAYRNKIDFRSLDLMQGYVKIVGKTETRIFELSDLLTGNMDNFIVAEKKPNIQSSLSFKNKIAPKAEIETPIDADYSAIVFEEDQSTGYASRTAINAFADATIAIAVDFETAGEKLTKQKVVEQKKKYIPVSAKNLQVTEERVNKIVDALNSVKAKSLNIAGNGIYSLKGMGITQTVADKFAFDLLSAVINSSRLNTKIESIRTGGQTGFDEAGAKAGARLGIPTKILAPKGFRFRNEKKQDISNEKEFKARFGISEKTNAKATESADVSGPSSMTTREATRKSLEALRAMKNKSTSNDLTNIYFQLGNKTVSENVTIKPWKQLKNATKAIIQQGVIATRIFNTNEHFGNPFSHDPAGKTQGLIKTETIKEAVEKYIEWVINSNDSRAEWIREQLKSGKLKGKPILYYKELGEPSHATALDYLINKHDWGKGKPTTFDDKINEQRKECE